MQRYLYDGAELAAEVNGSGNPLRTYTHFPGIDQPHSMRSWSGTTPGAVHHYALDLPGNNVNGLFDASGTVTHRYRYSPWGEAQVTSETTHNPLRFASRELDAATGLYFNRARWYDPYLGRFLSEDPIGIAGGINVYAYAGNDPVNYTDPWGLSPCTSGYVCLPGVTVVARPNNPWDTDPWNGVGDRGRGPRSIGGGRDGTWQDDGFSASLCPEDWTPKNAIAKWRRQSINYDNTPTGSAVGWVSMQRSCLSVVTSCMIGTLPISGTCTPTAIPARQRRGRPALRFILAQVRSWTEQET